MSRGISNASGDIGADMIKIATMAISANKAVASAGREGVIHAEQLVKIEGEAQEALMIVDRALEAVGRPCKTSDLASDGFEAEKVVVPAKVLNWKDYLRALHLRDNLEDAMLQLQVMPPKSSFLDGAGKLFGKEEKLEAMKKEFEEKHLQKKEFRLQGEVDVTEEEVKRRKKQMLEERDLGNLLKGYQTALLDIGRTHKVTKGGTNMSMRALVVIGNRNGAAGYGEGKSDNPQNAIARACRDAKRNILCLERYNDRTVFHRMQGEYMKTKVSIWPKPEGTGITANNYFQAVFQLFGLKDVGAKMHGPRTMSNSVKALFNGLARIRSAEKIARTRGLAIRDVYGVRLGEVSRRHQLRQAS